MHHKLQLKLTPTTPRNQKMALVTRATTSRPMLRLLLEQVEEQESVLKLEELQEL